MSNPGAQDPGGHARSVQSPSNAWLALRMTCWALTLPLLKHVVALPRLAALMWRKSAGAPSNEDVERVVRLSAAVARVRPLPGANNCLDRSLIAYRYLSALNADPRLVVAVRTADPKGFGHVWVTVNGTPVLQEDLSMFTPVLELGRRGRPISTA
jgi:Transglutaminase-like superfamily